MTHRRPKLRRSRRPKAVHQEAEVVDGVEGVGEVLVEVVVGVVVAVVALPVVVVVNIFYAFKVEINYSFFEIQNF
jgi:hypothetical protein